VDINIVKPPTYGIHGCQEDSNARPRPYTSTDVSPRKLIINEIDK